MKRRETRLTESSSPFPSKVEGRIQWRRRRRRRRRKGERSAPSWKQIETTGAAIFLPAWAGSDHAHPPAIEKNVRKQLSVLEVSIWNTLKCIPSPKSKIQLSKAPPPDKWKTSRSWGRVCSQSRDLYGHEGRSCGSEARRINWTVKWLID